MSVILTLTLGCTNPTSPNFDPWAFFDDGSCLPGTLIKLEVKATGPWGAYEVEGPGLYYTAALMSFNDMRLAHEDDLHTIYFTSWQQAAYTGDPTSVFRFDLCCVYFIVVVSFAAKMLCVTFIEVQLHGTIAASMSDISNQCTTAFQYLNYTSFNVSESHLETIRPAGPGCTQPHFINFSPFATKEDKSCIEGQFIQIDIDAASDSDLTTDWFGHGVVSIQQPQLLGGHPLIPNQKFPSVNISTQMGIHTMPGVHSVQIFGLANVRIALVETGDVLLNTDNRHLSLQNDDHGFSSTAGNSLFYFSVPEKMINRHVVSDDGGVIGSTDAGSIILRAGALESPTVVGIEVSEIKPTAAETLLGGGDLNSPQGSWILMGKIFQVMPLSLRLASPVTFMIPYDQKNHLTSPESSEMVVLRASDANGADWRVLPGASFIAGRAFVDIDAFGMFTVAARSKVLMVTPLRFPLNGGVPITLTSIDFHNTQRTDSASSRFCRIGSSFQGANAIDDHEEQGKTWVCASPAIIKAGFLNVELVDAGSLQTSMSDLRVLFTSSVAIKAIFPVFIPSKGGVIATVSGKELGYASRLWEVSRVGDNSGPAARMLDELECPYDQGRQLPAFLISSVLAICEIHNDIDLETAKITQIQLAPGFTSESDHFSYRRSIIDMMSNLEVELKFADVHHSALHGIDGVLRINLISKGDTVHRVNHELIYLDPIFRCSFGTVTVIPSLGKHDSITCISPANQDVAPIHRIAATRSRRSLISQRRLLLVGAPGEQPAVISTFREPSISCASGSLKSLAHGRPMDRGTSPTDFSQTLEQRAADPRHGTPHMGIDSSFPPLYPRPGTTLFDQLDHRIQVGFVMATLLVYDRHFSPTKNVSHDEPLTISYGGSSPALISSVGGGVCGTGGGGILWVAGTNLMQRERSNLWGYRSEAQDDFHQLNCEFGLVDSLGKTSHYQARRHAPAVHRFTGKIESPTYRRVAHVVSSALISCEPPASSNLEDANPSYNTAADKPSMRFSDSVRAAYIRLASGDVTVGSTSLAVKLVQVSVLERVVVTEGHETINLTWDAPELTMKMGLSLSIITCAFGTIAPVSLLLNGQSGGVCMVPVHAGKSNCAHPHIWLHLPNTGRVVAPPMLSDSIRCCTKSRSHQYGCSSPSREGPRDAEGPRDVVHTQHRYIGSKAIGEHILSRKKSSFQTVVDDFGAWRMCALGNTSIHYSRITNLQAPIIMKATPSHISSIGTTLLRIFGSNFFTQHDHDGSYTLSCVIESYYVDAVVVSSAVAVCEAPFPDPQAVILSDVDIPKSLGTYGKGDLHLSPSSWRSFSASPRKMMVHISVARYTRQQSYVRGIRSGIASMPQVTSVAPSSSAADRGGAVVSVAGNSFSKDTLPTNCAFGTVYVFARVTNTTSAKCISPAHVQRRVSFAFYSDGIRSINAGNLVFNFM